MSNLGELQAATSRLSGAVQQFSSAGGGGSSGTADTSSIQKVLMAKTLELQRTVVENQEAVKQLFNSEELIDRNNDELWVTNCSISRSEQ